MSEPARATGATSLPASAREGAGATALPVSPRPVPDTRYSASHEPLRAIRDRPEGGAIVAKLLLDLAVDPLALGTRECRVALRAHADPPRVAGIRHWPVDLRADQLARAGDVVVGPALAALRLALGRRPDERAGLLLARLRGGDLLPQSALLKRKRLGALQRHPPLILLALALWTGRKYRGRLLAPTRFLERGRVLAGERRELRTALALLGDDPALGLEPAVEATLGAPVELLGSHPASRIAAIAAKAGDLAAELPIRRVSGESIVWPSCDAA